VLEVKQRIDIGWRPAPVVISKRSFKKTIQK